MTHIITNILIKNKILNNLLYIFRPLIKDRNIQVQKLWEKESKQLKKKK